MAAFEVTIWHDRTAYLTVTVEASTAQEATEQVQGVIAACDADADAIATHYAGIWEPDDRMTIEGSAQVS